jgi:hypothetical protein
MLMGWRLTAAELIGGRIVVAIVAALVGVRKGRHEAVSD